jgi:hypothetical protein
LSPPRWLSTRHGKTLTFIPFIRTSPIRPLHPNTRRTASHWGREFDVLSVVLSRLRHPTTGASNNADTIGCAKWFVAIQNRPAAKSIINHYRIYIYGHQTREADLRCGDQKARPQPKKAAAGLNSLCGAK